MDASVIPPIVVNLFHGASSRLAEIDFMSNNPPWSAALFREEFAQNAARILGARMEGQIVGFIVLHVVVDEAHILNFGVDPASRGRGIGRTLLREALEKLKHEGVKRVTLEVRVGNIIAQNLYSSFGFQRVGTRPHYYRDNGEDGAVLAVLM